MPGRISAKTTAQVEKAARKLGYVPDPTARSLRTGRSGFVGVVVPDLTNPVIPPIVRGIEAVLWEAGLACLLADTHNIPEREQTLVAEFRARRCEGLIIASAGRVSPAVSSLAVSGLPAVLVTRETDETTLPLVAGDDRTGVTESVRHLVDLGHSHIAHLTGPPQVSTTVRREEAFRATMAAMLPDVAAIVMHTPAFSTGSGLAATREVLAHHPEITAILAGNDMIAVGVYEALDEAELVCPEDMSVVGHNDMPLVERLRPPLTTVAIPQFDIGAEAARTLLATLRDGASPSGRLLPARLVVRGSTAPPRPRVGV